MAESFQIGDKVRLVSQRMPMTVVGILPSDELKVAWIGSCGDLQEGVFPEKALMMWSYEDEEKMNDDSDDEYSDGISDGDYE